MTGNAFGAISFSPPDELLDAAGRGPHPLLSRPGLVLPLLLIAAALAAILVMSASLWQLRANALEGRVEDLDWTFAQTQVETLRLHEAAENYAYAGDASAAREFERRRALLATRLAQIESGPPRQLAEDLGLADDIAAARRAVLEHGLDAGGRPDRRELAALAADLARLDQVLASVGNRANSTYDAMKAGRMEQLRHALLLGSLLVLAGLLGVAFLGLRILRIEGRILQARRLELELQRERDDASYMRNIAAIISHQMRTPLAVIDSTASRVLGCPEGPGAVDVGTAMLRIRRQVRRVLHFMEQSMLAGRIEGQSLDTAPQPVALDDLIGMAMESEAIREQRDRIVLPPPAATRPRALCDRDLAFHALVNIIENALKYSPERSPVELHLAEADGMAVISVTDRGRGILAAEQAAIFQRFWRGSNAGDRPGTGIGLWLAQRLADIQGGTIRVASDGLTGARFDFCLPAAAGRGTAPKAPVDRVPASKPAGVHHGGP